MSDDNPKIDTSVLLANLKKRADPEVPVVKTAPALATAAIPAAPVVEVEPAQIAEYQQYTSSRIATCLITQSGKRINFTNYQYYTKDPDIIAYMDTELKNGLRGFRKGKKLTATELDPETAKKREIIDEFKASQEGREFGNTKPELERSTALSSDHVAN